MKRTMGLFFLAALLMMTLLAAPVEAEDIISSGSCGKDLTWTLDSKGTLTISGTGGMADYEYGHVNASPWHYYSSQIVTIQVNDGVNSIGAYAFCHCTSLTSVALPSSIGYIADGAFCGCSSLTDITIPDAVFGIGYEAFRDCSGLTSITLPSSLSDFREDAFYGCSGLTEIVIPDGVGYIPPLTFYGCSSVTGITIPVSVNSIGHSAFTGCSSLQRIDVEPDNPFYRSIDGVLYNAELSELVACPGGKTGSYALPSEVTCIDEGAFCGCGSLTEIIIGDNVTEIEFAAFTGCTSLQTITLPFVGKSKTTSKDAGDVSYLFGYVFGTAERDGQTAVTQYSYNRTTFSYHSRTYYIPASLRHVTITGGTIPCGAFYNCSMLTGIALPDNTKIIDIDVFAGCSSLKEFVIPEGVKTIDYNAFGGCSSLTDITIPDGVTEIADAVFVGCSSLKEIHTAEDNLSFCSVDGVLFSKDKTELVVCPGGKTGEYTIPSGVTEIRGFAFEYCAGLTDISVPDSVKKIGGYSFSGCSGLTRITIPESTTKIGECAFANCSSLMSAVIPGFRSVVVNDGNGAFENCTSLTSVTILGGRTNLSAYLFSGCTGLKIVYLPGSVKSVGTGAFSGCESLRDVYYSGSEEDWAAMNIGEENAFLTAANIHCGINPVETEIVGAGCEQTDGANVYNVAVYCAPGAVALACGVRYSARGQMLGLKTLHLTAGHLNCLIASAAEGESIRIIVLDGEGFAPLCAAMDPGTDNS